MGAYIIFNSFGLKKNYQIKIMKYKDISMNESKNILKKGVDLLSSYIVGIIYKKINKICSKSTIGFRNFLPTFIFKRLRFMG